MNRRLLGLVLALLPGALFGSAASGVAPWLYPSPPTNGQTWIYSTADSAWEPGAAGGAGTLTSIGPDANNNLTFTPNPITNTGTIGLALSHANTWVGAQTLSATGNPIGGVVDGSSAGAGKVGEVLSGQLLKASAVTVTYATAINLTSVALTAGDWDVTFEGDILSSSTSTVNAVFVAIETTTIGAPSTHPDQLGGISYSVITSPTVFTGAQTTYVGMPMQITINAGATYYLNLQINGSGTQCTAFGKIRARRMR